MHGRGASVAFARVGSEPISNGVPCLRQHFSHAGDFGGAEFGVGVGGGGHVHYGGFYN